MEERVKKKKVLHGLAGAVGKAAVQGKRREAAVLPSARMGHDIPPWHSKRGSRTAFRPGLIVFAALIPEHFRDDAALTLAAGANPPALPLIREELFLGNEYRSGQPAFSAFLRSRMRASEASAHSTSARVLRTPMSSVRYE